MGDLIIKPASSGSLKIQDQAGTDFITTGTSSGLTLGSGVTFPTGHTGISSYTVENENTWNGQSTSAGGTELFTGSGGFTSTAITPVSSSSKFFVTLTINATTDDHAFNYTASIILKRKIGSGSYAESDLVPADVGRDNYRVCFNVKGLSYNNGHSGIPYTISGIDSPSHSGSTVTYQVQYIVQDSGYPLYCNSTITNSDSTGTHHSRQKSVMTILEVA